MNVLVICLIVACCVVYITDYVGFTGEMVNFSVSLMTGGKIKHVQPRKLLRCSLCQTTWITLIILLCYQAWVYLPLCLVYGWSTQYILAIYNIIDRLLSKVLGFMQRITQ